MAFRPRSLTSGHGTFATSTDVRCMAAFGGKPDIKQTSQKGRVLTRLRLS
jgi:hypothetical protein